MAVFLCCAEFQPFQSAEGKPVLPTQTRLHALRELLERLVVVMQADSKWRLMRSLVNTVQADLASPAVRDAVDFLAVVAQMQHTLFYCHSLQEAADLSDLWLQECSSAHIQATSQQAAGHAPQHVPKSFVDELMQAALQQLAHMPAETPLVATHIFTDAANRLQGYGPEVENHTAVIKNQAEACLSSFVDGAVKLAYEHYKVMCSASQLATLPPGVRMYMGPQADTAILVACFYSLHMNQTCSVPTKTCLCCREQLLGMC